MLNIRGKSSLGESVYGASCTCISSLFIFPLISFFPFFWHLLAAAFMKIIHISLWPPSSSSSSAQLLSLGVELLKDMLYSQVGSPRDSGLLSNSTRGTLQSAQPPPPPPTPHLPPPLFLLPTAATAAASKCQHLFSINRVAVSVKRNCSAAGHLWTHEEKLPPLLVWLRGANSCKNTQPLKYARRGLEIFATIEYFPILAHIECQVLVAD